MSEKSLISPDAVNTIFTNFQKCLPVFVPAMPSIKIGLFITTSVTILSISLALIDKKMNENKKDIVSKVRWILVVIIGGYLGTQMGDFVREKHYTIRCITDNRQHYANLHLLGLYTNAYKKNA
jgi:hypothetical protein